MNNDLKKLSPTYVPGIENMPEQEILQTLQSIGKHKVCCLNWDEYPYAPQVGFHIAFSDNVIALLWEVKEDHVRAVSLEDNGPVWEDSCVELFISDPNSTAYFNFEMNCIGTMLASKKMKGNSDYIREFLYDVLTEYFNTFQFKKLDKAALIFKHVYKHV